MAFARPAGNSISGIHDPFRVRLINRLRLGFSQLREHKYKHNFADTVNPLCSSTAETKNTEHFFLRSKNNLPARTTLMNGTKHYQQCNNLLKFN